MDDPKMRDDLAHWLRVTDRDEMSYEELADRLLHSCLWYVRPGPYGIPPVGCPPSDADM